MFYYTANRVERLSCIQPVFAERAREIAQRGSMILGFIFYDTDTLTRGWITPRARLRSSSQYHPARCKREKRIALTRNIPYTTLAISALPWFPLYAPVILRGGKNPERERELVVRHSIAAKPGLEFVNIVAILHYVYK